MSSNRNMRRMPLAKRFVAAIVLVWMAAFQLSPSQAEVAGTRARQLVNSTIGLLREPNKTPRARGLGSRQQIDSTPVERATQITHFRLCPRHLSLYVGEDYTLVPVALDQAEQTVHGVAYGWQTSNAAVAKVSGGTVDALTPGTAVVTVSIGTARATVAVVVLPGARPRLTDAVWDIQHANDCTNPESVAVTEDDLKIAEANQLAVAEQRADEDSEAASSLQQLARPAVLRRVSTPTESPAKAVNGSLAVRAKPVAFQGGTVRIDGDGADPIVSKATASFSNAIGSPRFGPEEVSMGSAAKSKNNLGSYDYSFAVPIASLPGRGISLNLAMIYNSRAWSLDNGTMTFNYNKGWPAAGWSLGYGRLIDNYDGTARGDKSGLGQANAPGNFLLLQPDGTRIHLQQTYDAGAGLWMANSTDGSFITLNTYNGKLRYPDGTLVDFDFIQQNGRWLPTVIRNANGQKITIAYKPYVKTQSDPNYFPFRWAIDSIQDTAGRYVTFNYDQTTHYLTSITAPDQGSGTRTLVQISYQTITLQYNFSAGVVNAPAFGSSLDVVRRIYYPQTGRGYLFPDYSTYGMTRKLSMRIGMTTSSDGAEVAYTNYNYPDYDPLAPALADAPQYTTRSEWWQDKTDGAGNPTTVTTDYTYSRSAGTDSSGFATEIDTVQNTDSNLKIVTTTGNDAGAPDSFGHVLSTEYKDLNDNSLQKITYTYAPGPDGGTQVSSVTSVVDGGPQTKTAFSYGSYGRVATVDEYGFSASIQRRTSYAYVGLSTYVDDVHLVRLVNHITVYDGSNLSTPVAQTDFTYDDYAPTGGMISPTPLPPNHDFDATVTNRGNVTAVTTWVNVVNGPSITRYTQYDIFGNVRRQDVSCCNSKSFSFSDATTHYSQPDSVTDGTPNVVPFLTTSFAYDGLNTGLLLSTTDPQNRTTSFSYDNAWRLTTVTPPQSAFSTTTQFDKDANGNDLLAYSQKVSYTDTDGIAKTITSKSWFDGAGRVIRAGTGQGSSPTTFDSVKTLYDPVGRVLKQSNPYLGDVSGNGSPAYWTVNTYDPLSRVTRVTLPDNQTIQTTYASPNVTVTDQVGRMRQSQADGFGRLISVTEQDPATGVLSLMTNYGYDTLDNLTSVNQGGQTRSFSYDALSRMTSQNTPEGGVVNFTYTDFGAVQKRIDARNVETHYQYDTLNRLTRVWYTGLGGSDDPTVTPRPVLPTTVAATADVIIAYNNLSSAGAGNGEVSRLDDGGGFETFAYDSLSRTSSKTRTIDGVNSYQTQYQYNAINQLSLMIYPSGKRIRTNHDSRGRFSGEDKVDMVGTVLTSYFSGIGYNVAGQVTGMTSGSGVSESYSYSPDRLQLTSQTAVKGASTLMSLSYGYSASAGASGVGTTAGNSGQLITITGTINGANRGQSFNYDDVGRLVSASSWSSSQRSYSYDRWGNRTSMSDSITGANQSLSLQQQVGAPAGVPSNRIATVTNNGFTSSYIYDADGNVTNDGAHSYQYDGEGRIASVDGTGATYSYDTANRRVKKVTGGYTTYYIWEGSQVIAEYSNATAGAGGTSYYLSDRLSTRMTTDTNGTFKGTQDHLPFGEDGGIGGISEKHRFTNYERDAESGTDYAINRQQQYSSGRFMQPDPFAGSTYLTNPQTLNRYLYGWGDPLNKIDPLGLDSLLFDGCKLTQLGNDGKPIQSWDAVSGLPGTT
ncbi:MAG TPA: RHS repeat-associated core domain-containing protein, partial [Blastocatellia bacterium]